MEASRRCQHAPSSATLTRGTAFVSEPPYLTYSHYLRQRYGCVVYRVAVDAGFSCPNRKDGVLPGGCSYCAVDGSRAPYLNVRGAVIPGCAQAARPGEPGEPRLPGGKRNPFLSKRYAARAFILFFQAYSNTNAPGCPSCAGCTTTGLSLAPFLGLNVATRPDCLDEEKARLLASYRERGLDVWVELGLQSANDQTLRRIGRGHTSEDFRRAFDLLKDHGLKVGVHLIFGLPGEGWSEIMATMELVAGLAPGRSQDPQPPDPQRHPAGPRAAHGGSDRARTVPASRIHPGGNRKTPEGDGDHANHL